MSATDAGCSTFCLAAGGLGNVVFCTHCSVVTVSLQSVSIRFELAAFSELARMLAQARAALVCAASEAGPLPAEADAEPSQGLAPAASLRH